MARAGRASLRQQREDKLAEMAVGGIADKLNVKKELIAKLKAGRMEAAEAERERLEVEAQQEALQVSSVHIVHLLQPSYASAEVWPVQK